MSTAVVTVPKNHEIEFIPFGSEDAIKLSLSIIKTYIALPTKSGAMPTDRDCMRFMMLCRSRRLNPFEGDCWLVGYDGKDGPEFSLITAHQVFLKRAEKSSEFDGFESGVIVREGDDGDFKERIGDFLYPGDVLLGGWCTVHFKTKKFPTTRRLNVTVYRKANKFWNENAQGMIVKCAEADALRSSFPSLLGDSRSDAEGPIIEVSTVPAKAPDFETLAHPAKSAASLPERTERAFNAPGGVETPAGRERQPVAAAAATAAAPKAAEAKPQEPEGAPAGETPPVETSRQESEACGSVRLLMQKSGVTEAQLMDYARGNGMAKPDQKHITELSDAKLLTLGKAWHNILPKLRTPQQ